MPPLPSWVNPFWGFIVEETIYPELVGCSQQDLSEVAGAWLPPEAPECLGKFCHKIGWGVAMIAWNFLLNLPCSSPLAMCIKGANEFVEHLMSYEVASVAS